MHVRDAAQLKAGTFRGPGHGNQEQEKKNWIDGYVSSHVSVLVRDSCFYFRIFLFFSPCLNLALFTSLLV